MRTISKIFFTFLLTVSAPALAQQANDPSLPPPLQNMVAEGAQLRYLGRHAGLDGWISMHKGQEQYFYVSPDGQAILMGLLFDPDGKLVTVRQVKELQDKSGDTLNLLKSEVPGEDGDGKTATASAFKPPSEQLLDNVATANTVALGRDGAPVIYTFIDPQCPHCHDFLKDLRDKYIRAGLLQVRIIPVGFRDETRSQAAFLLTAPNPEERLFRHLDGDAKALPVTPGINTQGVERNIALMQSWKFDTTPMTVYRAKDGTVKIVQGRAKDAALLVSDVAAPAPALP